MSPKIIGRFLEMYGDSRGQVVRFIHTQAMLEFRLAWVQNWDYSKGSGAWGNKNYTDTGYELKIPRDEIKSINIVSAGDCITEKIKKVSVILFDIRSDISPISAIISSE